MLCTDSLSKVRRLTFETNLQGMSKLAAIVLKCVCNSIKFTNEGIDTELVLNDEKIRN